MGRRPFSLSLILAHLSRRHRRRHRISRNHRRRSVQPRHWMDGEEIERRVICGKRKLDEAELTRLFDDDDEVPRELEVVSASGNRMQEEEDDKAAAELEMEGLREEFRGRSDQDLEGIIRRLRGHVGTLALSDGGEKLKRSIKRIEAEIEWRKRHKEAYVCEKPLKSNAFSASIDQEIPLSIGKTHSRFFSNFCSKLELSDSRNTGSCNQPKRKPNGLFISQEEQTSRDVPFQCPTLLASNKSDHTPVNTNRMKDISALSKSQRSLPARLMKKAEAPPSINLFQARERQGNTVVCLDDDDEDADYLREEDNSSSAEEDILFDDMPHQLRNLKERFRGSKISYPSRDDPTSVDVNFEDIDCLDPQEYLSSPIMDFYIRYLQLHYLQQPDSPTFRSRCDYHFFNTYFYSKLTEAVSCKGYDDSAFTKFRRWWKGTNIFRKAYILLPIYEEKHWSLIIVCIPDRDKETGPIILHLDSLGFHHSPSIFESIKRFIREEWDHLTLEGAGSDLPWGNLPRRMEEKKITVPQQKNDYDCGLFVLYFIERFIVEAPERLCRKDLQMFGRRWFRPSEASALRTKIRRLLIKEFESSQQVKQDQVHV